MPVIFNFVCDERKDCAVGDEEFPTGAVQTLGFEKPTETFQDAIDAIQKQGWGVEVLKAKGVIHEVIVLCPKHRKEEFL